MPGWNSDYHFIIKDLANEFKGKTESLEENTKKYTIFTVPTETEVRNVDKDGNEDIITVFYKKCDNLCCW